MGQEVDLKAIRGDLKFLKRAVLEMQLALKSSDVFLDKSDKDSIDEYLKEKADDRLISHDELEKELVL
jgi:hypothetical protein